MRYAIAGKLPAEAGGSNRPEVQWQAFGNAETVECESHVHAALSHEKCDCRRYFSGVRFERNMRPAKS